MSRQDLQEVNNQGPEIEDLTVDEDTGREVKGSKNGSIMAYNQKHEEVAR